MKRGQGGPTPSSGHSPPLPRSPALRLQFSVWADVRSWDRGAPRGPTAPTFCDPWAVRAPAGAEPAGGAAGAAGGPPPRPAPLLPYLPSPAPSLSLASPSLLFCSGDPHTMFLNTCEVNSSPSPCNLHQAARRHSVPNLWQTGGAWISLNRVGLLPDCLRVPRSVRGAARPPVGQGAEQGRQLPLLRVGLSSHSASRTC